MTDRELLEAAAKAAGIDWQNWTQMRYLGEDGQPEPGLRDWPYDWNPLTDDGDALRLAVKLAMNVDVWRETSAGIRGRVIFADGNCFFIDGQGDPCAATRRAIVRAAAALSV
jgi:hypothetical protein